MILLRFLIEIILMSFKKHINLALFKKMRFEDSKYSKLYKYKKIEFPFGQFYLLEKAVISELNEGVHFDWDKILKVVEALLKHYGMDIKIGYISNRIYSYSIQPEFWIDFQREFDFIVATAVVSYTDYAYMTASLEKHFSKNSIKRCETLEEAIVWVENLREFKN